MYVRAVSTWSSAATRLCLMSCLLLAAPLYAAESAETSEADADASEETPPDDPPVDAERARASAFGDRDVRFSLTAGTEFPVAVAGKLILDLPYGLRTSVLLGWLPKLYLDGVNGVLVGCDAYPRGTGDLISSMLGNSFVVSARLGVDPWEAGGLYLEVGYTLLSLGGSTTATELLTAVIGHRDWAELVDDDAVPASSLVHNISLNIGYTFVFFDHLLLTLDVGVFKAVGSKTRIEMPGSVAIQQKAAAAIEKYLDDIYLNYLIVPSAALHLGWRF